MGVDTAKTRTRSGLVWSGSTLFAQAHLSESQIFIMYRSPNWPLIAILIVSGVGNQGLVVQN